MGQEFAVVEQHSLFERHLQRVQEELSEGANVSQKHYRHACQVYQVCFVNREFSRVLVYDWSEPGDTEIVVEDIEALELDLIPAYDEQQRDWRFNTEETAMSLRFAFTNGYQLAFKYCVPMEGKNMFVNLEYLDFMIAF